MAQHPAGGSFAEHVELAFRPDAARRVLGANRSTDLTDSVPDVRYEKKPGDVAGLGAITLNCRPPSTYLRTGREPADLLIRVMFGSGRAGRVVGVVAAMSLPLGTPRTPPRIRRPEQDSNLGHSLGESLTGCSGLPARL